MLISLHHCQWHMHKMHWTSIELYSIIVQYHLSWCIMVLSHTAQCWRCTMCLMPLVKDLIVAGWKWKQGNRENCMPSVHRTHFRTWHDCGGFQGFTNLSFAVHPTATLHKSRVHLLGRVDSNFALVVKHAMPMDQQLQAVLRRVAPQAHLDALLLSFSDLFEIPHSSHSRI